MDEQRKKVEDIVGRYPKSPSSIIPVLQDINDEFRFLPCEAVEMASEMLGVPRTKAFSIATFYKALSLKERGKIIIKICKGTACHIRGAEQISDELSRELNLKAGETSADKAFTIEEVNCVGACAMAPVVVVNDKYHGGVTPDSIGKLVGKERDAK